MLSDSNPRIQPPLLVNQPLPPDGVNPSDLTLFFSFSTCWLRISTARTRTHSVWRRRRDRRGRRAQTRPGTGWACRTGAGTAWPPPGPWMPPPSAPPPCSASGEGSEADGGIFLGGKLLLSGRARRRNKWRRRMRAASRRGTETRSEGFGQIGLEQILGQKQAVSSYGPY